MRRSQTGHLVSLVTQTMTPPIPFLFVSGHQNSLVQALVAGLVPNVSEWCASMGVSDSLTMDLLLGSPTPRGPCQVVMRAQVAM